MIKICDHEDILNNEIKKVQAQYDLKFQMYDGENQVEIENLFEKMKR